MSPRPPRYRFPNEVRETTRAMSAEMVREESIPDDPVALDAWIAAHPERREALERGGYGERFTGEDLLPLLDVFIVQSGGTPRPAEAEPEPTGGRSFIVLGAAAAGLVILLILLAVSIL
jgi:hypothetical protein